MARRMILSFRFLNYNLWNAMKKNDDIFSLTGVLCRRNFISKSEDTRPTFSGSIFNYIKESITADVMAVGSKLSSWQYNTLKSDQNLKLEDFNRLGPELHAARYIVQRYGAVQLVGSTYWIQKGEEEEKELMNFYDPDTKVEALDISRTSCMYNAFDNFENLAYIKELRINECVLINDFCLDRLVQFRNTLECLEISDCPKVTERGIQSLVKLRNLKELKLKRLEAFKNKELVLFLLQDVLKDTRIIST